MNNNGEESSSITLWHRFLARIFELTIGRLGIKVETEVQVSGTPPKIDIVLLRKENRQWTEEQRRVLPDGVRDSNAQYILLAACRREPKIAKWDTDFTDKHRFSMHF